MRFSRLCAALCATIAVASADSRPEYSSEATISIQPVGAQSSDIHTLAQVHYNPSTLEATISSYEPPSFGTEAELVKLGVYDSKSATWDRATATSALNFAKGYAPVITLALHADGNVAGVSCRSERIDAGHTRDFGPKVVVTKVQSGKAPELNRPIALSREGKVEVEVPEKTILQK